MSNPRSIDSMVTALAERPRERFADPEVHAKVVGIANRIKAGHVVHIADDVLVLIKREWRGMEKAQS